MDYDVEQAWKNYLLEDTKKQLEFRSNFQRTMFTILNDYRDFYYPYRTPENESTVLEAYVLHLVNHLVK